MNRKRVGRSAYHPLIAKAVRHCGTQAKLADATGISQQAICRALNRQAPVSAELAARIEIATSGLVTRAMLRPDLFFAPVVQPAFAAAATDGARAEHSR